MKLEQLTDKDIDAMVDHFMALSPGDYYLRFASAGNNDRDRVKTRTAGMLKRGAWYGVWNGSPHRHLELIVSFGANDPAKPERGEVGISALASARGGATAEVSGELVKLMLAQKFKVAEGMYLIDNAAVAAVTKSVGAAKLRQGAVVFFEFDLQKLHDDMVATYLTQLDVLLKAVRSNPGARL